MTPERYQQIGELFDAALEQSPAERSEWVARASGDDLELRAAVENLLANHHESEEFLERPAMDVAAYMLMENQPAATDVTGQQISHYQIHSLLGAGGMGQVYLAKDTKLGRQVALKLLPSRYLQSAEHVRRFEREALAASALNHPNILTIYEFGVDGETHFLATEFVQGENLRQRFARGPMPVAEVLDIALQIAAALQTAHEAGIIHRDVKPDNVMIRTDGIVKVLDFGLAKLTEIQSADFGMRIENVADPMNQTPQLTLPGAVLGTVAYMSPEQARGNEVDARADLFSLGVVLYEMLSGRRPFTGETVNHIIVAILEQEPPPLVGQAIPLELERILKQLLAKNLAARYPSAAVLLRDLKQLVKSLERETEWPSTTPAVHEAEVATAIMHLHTNEQLGEVTMQMPADDSSRHAVDLAHVLFCDIVGYSLLPIDRQTHAMQTLQRLVRQTDDYKRADAKGQLVRLPAGDGMALAFLQDVTAPVRCALDLTRAMRKHMAEIQLRIGIHSGPVYQSADINANRNVVGSGINLAQRVMDCGDAGHILISRTVAEVLEQVSHWQPMLHDLGEHEVKHGVKVHIYNLYSEEIGNPIVPAKMKGEQLPPIEPIPVAEVTTDIIATRTAPNLMRVWILGTLLATLGIGISVWYAMHARSIPFPTSSAVATKERSFSYFLTVQRYRNGKPYQAEFQSSGREIFEPGWQFKLNITSPQEGYLYLLNETPNDEYVLLFPIPSRNNGSAHLAANERCQTGTYLFDEQRGTERFRLVWSAQPVPELEAVRGIVNPTDKGLLKNLAQIQAVRAFVQQHTTSPTESVRDTQNQQTIVRGTGDVMIALVELEHR